MLENPRTILKWTLEDPRINYLNYEITKYVQCFSTQIKSKNTLYNLLPVPRGTSWSFSKKNLPQIYPNISWAFLQFNGWWEHGK